MFIFALLPIFLLLAANSGYANAVATFAGEGTWYDPAQDQGIGACGWKNHSTEYVVAIAFASYNSFPGAGANPNTDPICGQVIQVNYGGKSVVAQVVDKCLTCMLPNDVDMSDVTFKVVADPGVGRLQNPGITWSYVPKDTPLGHTSSPAPPPPPDTPLPPARRAFESDSDGLGNEQRKRSSEGSTGSPPHDRRMVKRRAMVGKSDKRGERGSIEPRGHLRKTNGNPGPDPSVPQRRAKKRSVEHRKPPSERRTPFQLPSVERRMIKVALFKR